MIDFKTIAARSKAIWDKSKIPLPDLVFWVSFSLLLVIHCIENTSLTYLDAAWLKYLYLFRNMIYLVLLAKAAFLSTYRVKDLFVLGAVFLVSAASLVGSGDAELLKFCIIVIAAKDVSPRTLVLVFAWIKGVGTALTLLLCQLNLLPTLYYENGDGYYNTYGFCHRNVLSANVAILCLAWFYLRYRKLTIRDVVVWGIIGLITYGLAVSRTGLIIMYLVIISVFLFQKVEQRVMNVKNIRSILLGVFLALLLLSVLCMIFYSSSSSFWVTLDKFFTKRLRFSNYYFEEYGLSLFGQELPLVSTMEAQVAESEKMILDNAYIRVLLYYGLIPGALFLFTYWKALDRSIQSRDGALIICLLILAVYGLSERYMLDIYYQFPLLIACQQYLLRSADGSEDRQPPLQILLGLFHQKANQKQ